jgi:hypothetical protein
MKLPHLAAAALALVCLTALIAADTAETRPRRQAADFMPVSQAAMLSDRYPFLSDPNAGVLRQRVAGRRSANRAASRWSVSAARHGEALSRTRIVAHPAGCPRRRFCGCGVSKEVFGKPIRRLYLAANWLKFPRAHPAPGMVAARRGHVFLIKQDLGGGKVLAYDPNSGGGKTRIHVRSLAGYKVVNPHGARLAQRLSAGR